MTTSLSARDKWFEDPDKRICSPWSIVRLRCQAARHITCREFCQTWPVERDMAPGGRGFESTWSKLYCTYVTAECFPVQFCDQYVPLLILWLEADYWYIWGVGGWGGVPILPYEFRVGVVAKPWVRILQASPSNITLSCWQDVGDFRRDLQVNTKTVPRNRLGLPHTLYLPVCLSWPSV